MTASTLPIIEILTAIVGIPSTLVILKWIFFPSYRLSNSRKVHGDEENNYLILEAKIKDDKWKELTPAALQYAANTFYGTTKYNFQILIFLYEEQSGRIRERTKDIHMAMPSLRIVEENKKFSLHVTRSRKEIKQSALFFLSTYGIFSFFLIGIWFLEWLSDGVNINTWISLICILGVAFSTYMGSHYANIIYLSRLYRINFLSHKTNEIKYIDPNNQRTLPNLLQASDNTIT